MAAVLLFPMQLYRGWVVAVLWGWFAVPMGAPPMAVLTATGLVLIVSIATPSHGSAADSLVDETPPESFGRSLGGHLVATTVALGIGLVLHQIQGQGL